MALNQNSQLEILRALKQTPELFSEIASVQGDEFQIQKQLRKSYSDEVVRAALSIYELRIRASSKFEHATSMWFDRQRLEQATSELIASHKAKRFQQLQSDDAILDMCCGIGGDAIALAQVANVVGIDIDSIAVKMAQWNCEAYGVADRFTGTVANIEDVDVDQQLVHIDPDRRSASGKRSLRLEGYQPNLDFLQELQQRARGGAMKVGPASNFGGKFPGAEMELISLNGECKEAVVWFGELAGNTETRATALPDGATLTGDPLSAYVDITEPQTYIYNPDPAVVRAGLIDVLAESLQLCRLDPAEEYLTASRLVSSPFLQAFELVESLPFQQKLLRQYFRNSHFGQLDIKIRHLKTDVEKLRKQLPLPGDQPGVLILVKNENKTRALVCQRVLSK